jgi:hypothetical protein
VRGDKRRKFTRLIWKARLRTCVGIAAFFGVFAAILLLVFTDDYEAQPPELAILLSIRVIQDEVKNRWVWIIEIDGDRIASVRPHVDIDFEPGKVVCIQRRIGERLGLQGVRILYEGLCKP